MANLQDDLGAAIVATINANKTPFSSLGVTGSTIHAEYAGQPVNYNAGATGRCLVRPLEQEIIDGTEYAESMQVNLPFALEFDLVDVMDAGNARSAVTQALRSVFGERGAAMFANFTDNGSNRLGKSGVLKVLDAAEESTGDPDRPRLIVRVEVRGVWVKIPAV